MHTLIALMGSLLINTIYSLQTYQHLSISQDNNLNFSFFIGKQHLPLPLREVPNNFNTQIAIQYRSGIQYVGLPYQHNQKSQPFISMFIRNNSQTPILSSILKQIIAGTFSIAINDRYLVYLSETQQFFYSSPNDKFCVQHLDEIVNNILPCKNHAGLGMLIDTGTLFHAKRFVGMKVDWIGEGMKIELLVSPLVQFSEKKKIKGVQLTGIKRTKILEKCQPYFHDFSMTSYSGQPIPLTDLPLDILQKQFPKKEHLSTKYGQKLKTLKHVTGNWYSKHKQISHRVFLESKSLYNKNYVIRELVPGQCELQYLRLVSNGDQAGIQLKILRKDNVQEYCSQLKISQYNQDSRFNASNYNRYGKSLIPPRYCEIGVQAINRRNSSQQSNKYFFTIQMDLKCYLIPFDQYENIFGGGQQLPSIPIAIYNPADKNKKVQYLSVNNSIMRVPLPDDGVPFIVMTLVLIVLAYIYLSLWKNLKFKADEFPEQPQPKIKQQ